MNLLVQPDLTNRWNVDDITTDEEPSVSEVYFFTAVYPYSTYHHYGMGCVFHIIFLLTNHLIDFTYVALQCELPL